MIINEDDEGRKGKLIEKRGIDEKAYRKLKDRGAWRLDSCPQKKKIVVLLNVK